MDNVGFGFLLGNEYERRKQKLRKELQLESRHHFSQEEDLRGGEPHPQPEALSLPIDDRTSAKEPTPSRRDAATLTESLHDGRRSQAQAPRRQQRKRWFICAPGDPRYREEELDTDEDEEFESRRQGAHAEERPGEDSRRERSQKRTPQHTNETDSAMNSDDRTLESDLQMKRSLRTDPRPAPGSGKEVAEPATGLMIGAAEEQTVAQMRKERYKQELLKQIEEQKRNKVREKTLELRVAATGATDPEKDPDRIKHFGPVNQQRARVRQEVPHRPGKDPEAKVEGLNPDERAGDSRVDHSAALRQLPGKRVSGIGARPRVQSGDCFSEDYHKDFSNMLGDMAVPRVAAFDPLIAPSVPETYKTPYDAAYYYYGARHPLEPNLLFNQPGLSGSAGHSGNIVNPFQRPPRVKSSGHLQAADQHGASPLGGAELHQDRAKQRRESSQSYQEALRQQIEEKEEQKRREKDRKVEAQMLIYNPWGRSGGGAPNTDPTGNIICDLRKMRRFSEKTFRNPSPSHQPPGFGDEASQQKLDVQNEYKEALQQQIEERRRKQEEERERIREEEEKEERRLARREARILQEYEDEQRRQTMKRRGGQKPIQPPETPRQKVEKEEDAGGNGARRSGRSHITSTRSHPAGAPQTREGQQELDRVSSALRRLFREEQERYEARLDRRSPEEPPYAAPTRRRPQRWTFERLNGGSPSGAAMYVNKDHIREFNRLKYRDTDSREEVRAMFPDPPADAPTLDLQQQALLRQQQRSIRRMRQQHGNGAWTPLHTDRSLHSDSTFIAFHGSAGSGDQARRPPAEGGGAAGDWTSPDCDVRCSPARRLSCSLQTEVNLSVVFCEQEREESDASPRSIRDLDDRISVETVATEPWLRPGSSAADSATDGLPGRRTALK
ncbi:LOW QUALITY PROTEIN: centrosome and spindle pole associated protein 1 [Salarias fasciatus]|uniref:LOW QUALITY PROTEIN: centrosome and spindle pole associated protein 1 n=1 Tax=Salarias fasciatus TaxID=181472 RepID=UPI00117651F1|nr:LOW QUALITY PROTEIN: centrosome and spindle pole-associated protein 1 [Salarias fasciatus]